jgi:hypothetical protein
MRTASRHRRARAAAAITALVASAAPRARAEGPVEAEILFKEGRRLLAAGQIADACDKLDASARIERTVGVLLNGADCRERNHQLATAWATFLEAASLARRQNNDARGEAEARHRAALLEPRLAYLVVSVPDASKIDGLVIRRAGAEIDPALWNQGVPIDDGAYDVTASAPGREPWSTHVEVTGEGTRAVVEVPRFKPLAPPPRHDEEDPTASAPPRRDTPPPLDRIDPIVDATADPHTLTRTRKLALGVAALGAASLAGGVVLGVRAHDLAGQADGVCPGSVCNDPGALAANRDARNTATVADALLIGGGAAIAGAAVLWFVGAPTAPSRDVVATPVVTPSSVGFAVSGRF